MRRRCSLVLAAFMLLLLMGTASVAAQSERDLLAEADSLVAARQYASAFELLSGADNASPRTLARQIDIAVDYFAQSIMHQMFAFKDLEPGESLMNVRRGSGDFTMHLFDPASIAEPVLEKNPDPVLAAALARFYIDALSRYGDGWTKPVGQVQSRVIELVEIAQREDAADYETLSVAGEYLLRQNRSAQAAALLSQSVRKNPNHGPAQYNYAIALAQSGRAGEGIPHAQRAAELYESKQLRSDAMILAGQLYSAIGNPEEALTAFENARQIAPEYHYPYQFLIAAYLTANRTDDAAASASKLVALDPTNPSILQIVLNTYYQQGALEGFLRVTETLFENYDDTTESEIRGNILFHQAVGQLQLGLTDQGAASLREAQIEFEESLPPDHQVFDEINRLLSQI